MRKTWLYLPVVALLSLVLAFPAMAAGGGGNSMNNAGTMQNDVYRGYGTDGSTYLDTDRTGTVNRMDNGAVNRSTTFGNRANMNRVNDATGTYRARAGETTGNNANWGWLGLLGLAGLTGLFRGNNENRERA